MMNRSKNISIIAELDAPLLRRPADENGPVFNAPWEAQAFAMTLSLHERGVFTWKEWAASLTLAIRDAQQRGDKDTGETYYLHWLDALERITTAKGLVSDASLVRRKTEWEDAARHTPHGKPIVLGDSAATPTK